MSILIDTLRARALHPVTEDQRARLGLGVVAFVLLAAVSAQVAIRLPWTPVPVTLQPLIVVLAGVLLGARAGSVAMVAYVTVGALGAPVFANGGAGLPWLFGPTGGYLLAAPAAAFVAGAVSGRAGAPMRLFAGLALGVVTMYVGGISQLMAITGLGVREATVLGAVPFLVGDGTKVLLAFFGVQAWRRVQRPES
jgi:biotin transport system substrate-specific component